MKNQLKLMVSKKVLTDLTSAQTFKVCYSAQGLNTDLPVVTPPHLRFNTTEKGNRTIADLRYGEKTFSVLANTFLLP